MLYQIEWCSYAGGDDGDQAWTVAVPGAPVDVTDRAACEREAALLDEETEGRYRYRVVAVGLESESVTAPQKTTVDRWDPRAGKWFQVELEIAS